MLDYLLVLFAYLCGSVSSAIVVCKLMQLDDPRIHGSKNPGATNVLRLHGKKAAATTLAGDVLKGLLPVLLAHAVHASHTVIALSALAAFLGHLYPVFFAFRGGKGVATFIGVLLGIYWPLGLAFMVTWLVIALLFRYSSLASLGASTLTPVYTTFLLPQAAFLISIIIMVLFMYWRHRNNIRNLINGREDKLKFGKQRE